MKKENGNIPEPGLGQPGQMPGGIPGAWNYRLLAAVPLPVVVGLVTVFDIILPGPAQFNRSLTFEPPFLNAVLGTIFIGFTSFAVAYLSYRSYSQNGWFFLVLLGCGALVWGSMSLLGVLLTGLPSGPNPAITIQNTGGLVAAGFHMTSALWKRGPSHRSDLKIHRSILVISYTGVLAFTAIFSLLALAGMIPPFFVPGVGQTVLRMAVLGAGAGLFLSASFLFWIRYYSSGLHSKTLYWYFLALGLTGVGLAAVFFLRAPGDPMSWTGRAAVFLGGAYFLKAVHTAFKPL